MSSLSSIFSDIPTLIISIPVILLSLSAHEAAHGFAAWKMGDPTAKNLGRVTLNPLKHLDPIGTLCMLLFRVGWARPVPINSRNFRDGRKGTAVTAAAGPLSNLLLAFLGLLCMHILSAVAQPLGLLYDGMTQFRYNIVYYLYLFFYLTAWDNIYLAVFNLIPVPPFDGSRILFIFLPPRLYFGIMKYERYIQLAILFIFWTGVLSTPLYTVASWLIGGMDWLISLIPFL